MISFSDKYLHDEFPLDFICFNTKTQEKNTLTEKINVGQVQRTSVEYAHKILRNYLPAFLNYTASCRWLHPIVWVYPMYVHEILIVIYMPAY